MSAKDRESDQHVLNYLKKKGYKGAAAQLQMDLARAYASAAAAASSLGAGPPFQSERTAEQAAFESRLDSEASISNIISSFGAIERSPERYDEAYCALRDWIYASLDRYKVRIHIPPQESPNRHFMWASSRTNRSFLVIFFEKNQINRPIFKRVRSLNCSAWCTPYSFTSSSTSLRITGPMRVGAFLSSLSPLPPVSPHAPPAHAARPSPRQALVFLQKHQSEHEHLHLDEIQRLQAVTTKQKIEENQVKSLPDLCLHPSSSLCLLSVPFHALSRSPKSFANTNHPCECAATALTCWWPSSNSPR